MMIGLIGPMLGQTPSPQGLWDLLMGIGFIVSVLANVALLFAARRKRETRRIEPQPLEVDGEIRVTPKGRRFSAEACDGRHAALNKQVETLDAYTRTEVGRLHDKIDVVERRVDDNLQRSIEGLRETIRKLPAEVISLLRTTGQLKDHHD